VFLTILLPGQEPGLGHVTHECHQVGCETTWLTYFLAIKWSDDSKQTISDAS
jgi:hypothetical protein